MAASMLWLRQPRDTFGVLGLALNACDERSNGRQEETGAHPGAAGRHADLWELAGEQTDEELQRRATRGAFRLLHLANVLAVTSA